MTTTTTARFDRAELAALAAGLDLLRARAEQLAECCGPLAGEFRQHADTLGRLLDDATRGVSR